MLSVIPQDAYYPQNRQLKKSPPKRNRVDLIVGVVTIVSVDGTKLPRVDSVPGREARESVGLAFPSISQPEQPIQPAGALIEPGSTFNHRTPWADELRGFFDAIRRPP